jgi:hypothetical protein
MARPWAVQRPGHPGQASPWRPAHRGRSLLTEQLGGRYSVTVGLVNGHRERWPIRASNSASSRSCAATNGARTGPSASVRVLRQLSALILRGTRLRLLLLGDLMWTRSTDVRRSGSGPRRPTKTLMIGCVPEDGRRLSLPEGEPEVGPVAC